MADSNSSSAGVREGKYEAAERFTLAEAPGLRVRQLGLAVGQCVPWHYHSDITDTLFCMKGPIRVKLRSPAEVVVLQPGETLAIPPGRPHLVAGEDNQACQFMAVQGVGIYDYVAADE